MEIVPIAIAVPIIAAVVQVAKGFGLPTQLALVLAVVLGVVYSLFGSMPFFNEVVIGIVTGLAAGGTYDAAKAVRNV